MADAVVAGRLALAAVEAKAHRRGLLVARTLGAATMVVFETLGVVLLLDRFDGLGGWGTGDVVVLLGLGQAGLGFAMLLGDTLEPPAFSLLVREGRLDPLLARPFPVLLSVMTSDLQVRELGRAAAGLGVVAWGGSLAGVAWGPASLGAAALAVVCCTAVVVAVLVLGAAATLYTVEGNELVNAFTYGAAALTANPMQIYGSVLRFVFLWLVPVGLAVYVPALHVLDREGPSGIPASLLPLTPVLTVVFAAVAGLAWRQGIRHYASTGS